MLERFSVVWGLFGNITANLPTDVVTVAVTVFCLVGIVGVLRSL